MRNCGEVINLTTKATMQTSAHRKSTGNTNENIIRGEAGQDESYGQWKQLNAESRLNYHIILVLRIQLQCEIEKKHTSL